MESLDDPDNRPELIAIAVGDVIATKKLQLFLYSDLMIYNAVIIMLNNLSYIYNSLLYQDYEDISWLIDTLENYLEVVDYFDDYTADLLFDERYQGLIPHVKCLVNRYRYIKG